MTYPRSHLVSADEPGSFHVVWRCVRRAFFVLTTRLTGKSFQHRPPLLMRVPNCRALESDGPLNNRIVAMKPYLTQMTKAENEMHYQKQHNSATTENRSHGLVPKAPAQAFTQINDIEQLLKEQQPGKRCELLVLELEGGKVMGFLNGFSFAILHLKRPSVCVFGNGFVATNYIVTVWPLLIFNGLCTPFQTKIQCRITSPAVSFGDTCKNVARQQNLWVNFGSGRAPSV